MLMFPEKLFLTVFVPFPGLQKDSDDARASSFLKILELIPHTFRPPLMLFVENVVGFEVCTGDIGYQKLNFALQLVNALLKIF